jgi:hypothetical protein
MASLELLGRVAAAGALVSFGGAFALFNYVKTNIETASYFSEALTLVKASPDAMLALEGECDVQDIKLFGETRTRLRANEAQVGHAFRFMFSCLNGNVRFRCL